MKNNINDNYWNIGIFDPNGININPLNLLQYSNQYKNLAKFWSNLPAYSMAKQIVETILCNDIILIKSGTGSGKTVLLPKLCLHANNYSGRIIITLPKKIITKKAAEYAAKTLDVNLGEQIGYQFRGDNLKSKKTILLYSTDGSIISMLKSDPLLKSIDMILIDEAHERKVNIDLLLYLLKNAIKLRQEKKFKPLKLIIMSATIDEQLFQTYYKNFNFQWMELAGTPNYPIHSIYLESSLDNKTNQYIEKGKEIIGQIIAKINSNNTEYIEGDILFFVCTVSECNKLAEELSNLYPECFTMGLYSGFDSELEQYISSPDKFKELNKKFKRRLFISTNVAESSLTIDGIVYVIDSGLELNVKFNPETNTNVMSKNFITQAQMTQRKGRAGRTKPGVCFHLYTPLQQESALKFPEPEIKCIDLKNTCMSLLKMCSDINKDINKPCNVENTIEMFLNFIEPPSKHFILNGFDFAYSNGLIDKDNKLSIIGQLVIESKLDIMDSIALIYAHNISELVFKTVFKIISICSLLKSSINDLFYEDTNNSVKKKIINKLLSESDNSEHLLLYNLYKYIEINKNSGIFNLILFDNITNIYLRQINKLEYIYSKYNIKLDDIKKKNLNTNIINSFCYGYKTNRAFKSSQGFKYNYKVVDLSKCLVKFNSNVNSIIFYSNLYWFNKLNIFICSPYLLK
jgi:HrpA-like RNA helicase